MLKYLQQVEKVTAAAAAVENDCFESDSLNEVATRSDELGQLARVFQRMVQTLKDREQELSEAKEQLEAVLNAVPGSISWINTNGVYLGVNKHLAENLNSLPENVNGQKLEFFKSQSQFAQFMSKFLSSQQTAASQEIEVQINNSKRYYLIAAQKYQQGNAAVTVGIDITDRKRAQEALRIAEENYRSIFENALDGIFQSTFDGHYINVNPAMAQIHGYDSPQEMMVTVAEIGSQLYVEPSCRQDFQRLMEAQGEVKGFEYQVYQRDGNIIWVEENTRAVGDTNGNLFYYEGIIQDITKRKQEEDALKQQVQDLRIEIDQQKRVCQVAAITQTDYFREIQAQIESMRFDEDF
ncbi:MAG: PAS domain S-box protein [Symploca sp. SIO1A3]|nr:PAS domain S-box protein [Symploca sp. SIO1A3]